MTLQEVNTALRPSEPYYDAGGGPNYYYLHVRANNHPSTQLAVGNMSLAYDNNEILVYVGREVSMGDWGEGSTCNTCR